MSFTGSYTEVEPFKVILALRINIRECEDYKNTFARIESDCTLRFGFKALISILGMMVSVSSIYLR